MYFLFQNVKNLGFDYAKKTIKFELFNIRTYLKIYIFGVFFYILDTNKNYPIINLYPKTFNRIEYISKVNIQSKITFKY